MILKVASLLACFFFSCHIYSKENAENVILDWRGLTIYKSGNADVDTKRWSLIKDGNRQKYISNEVVGKMNDHHVAVVYDENNKVVGMKMSQGKTLDGFKVFHLKNALIYIDNARATAYTPKLCKNFKDKITEIKKCSELLNSNVDVYEVSKEDYKIFPELKNENLMWGKSQHDTTMSGSLRVQDEISNTLYNCRELEKYQDTMNGVKESVVSTQSSSTEKMNNLSK